MVSTHTDINKSSQTNKSEAKTIMPDALSEIPKSSTTKRTLRDCELDLLSCNSSLMSSSNMNRCGITTSSIPVSTSSSTKSTSTLMKLQGQRWQQYLDYEKIVKQLRYAEKVHIKMTDLEGAFPSSSNKTSTGGGGTLIKSNHFKYSQQQKQVQRLNGSEMHYYGLAPKQEALEIVICNICKGIYTKIGFNNHMVLQHASIWNTVPSKTLITTDETTSKNSTVSRDDHLRDLDRIEFGGLSSDSSTTASSITSLSSASSLISSFGGNARGAKGNRSSNSSSSPSIGSSISSGRSRYKGNKNHMPSSTTATELPNVVSTVSTSPIVNELNLSSSSSSKITLKKLADTLNHTTTQQLPSALSCSTAKVLPTFGNTQTSNPNRNPTTLMGISAFSNSSNSSTSSASSTSSKTSSLSTNSTPSETFPNLRSISMVDGSNNTSAQLEIVSSSTAYYVDSTEKSIKGQYSTDSFEKTDDNTTITSISDMREIDRVTTPSVSSDALSMVIATMSSNTDEQISIQKKINNTMGSDNLPSLNLLTDENFETSSNSNFNKTEIVLSSENLISSSIDNLNAASSTPQNNNSIRENNSNTERLQLSTVSTSGISPTSKISLSNTYSKFSSPIQHYSNKIIKFDNICGVTINSEYGGIKCTRPLTCNTHSHAAKLQVTGRSRPFNELVSIYCADKENLLSMKDIVDSSNSSSSVDFGVIPSASSCPTSMVSAQELTKDNISPNDNISSAQFSKADNDKAFMSMNLQDRNLSTAVPIFSTLEGNNGNIKTDLTHPITCNKFPSMLSTVTAVSSNNQSQQNIEQSCDERAQTNNCSDDNSILTLDGIFDQTTQLEMLDSKFITEILNNTATDINFDDLDASSSQTRLQQPAMKRLKLDDTIQRVDNEMPALEQHQVNSFVNGQSMMQQVNEFKNEYASTSQQGQQQSLDIQYQTELNNVLQQHQPDQLTAIEAMQFQQLLYQHCTFNNLDATVLDQDQLGQGNADALINNNELTSNFPAEDENYHPENASSHENISEYNNNFINMECNIDENSREVIELRFHVIHVPSLTDEQAVDIVDLTSSQEDNTDQYVLPAEDELLFEITADNHVSLISQQQHVITELLTQNDYNAATQKHSNSNIKKDKIDIYSSDDLRVKHSGVNGSGLAFFYDYSYLETSTDLQPSHICGETKMKTTHKYFLDDFNYNMNQFIGIPRPIRINNFGLIKLPLTLATVFRKDLLISRKANHDPITFTRSGTSIVGNSMHGCLFGGNIFTTRFGTGNTVKNTTTNSALSSNASIMINALNEFAVDSGTRNSSIPQMKQQKTGVELLNTSLNNNNNNAVTSTTNETVSSANTLIRHQQKTAFNVLSNSGSPNVNNKTTVAIVNPSMRLTSSTQTNNISNNSNYDNSNYTQNSSKFINSNTNNNNNNTNATVIDHVKLIKRSPISKLTALKATATFFTPQIISEMFISNPETIINPDVQNASFDTRKFFRNNNLYNRRRLYKYNKNHSGLVRNERQ